MDRNNTYRPIVCAILIAAISCGLAGCGVAAFPERATSATVKMVPVAGHVVAYPLDKTADAID
jgi:hypothetical protein